MSIEKRENHFATWLFDHLPIFLILLFVLQPLMDILSYWTDRLGMGNTLTLALRFAVLAVFGLLGFCISRRKKAYGIAAAACAVLLLGHCLACYIKGYLDPISDLTNFVRVIQMPLFVFCFISCLRANDKCYRAIEIGLIINFWIISVSVAASVLTGTASATYQESSFGILGWFATSNAQSSVMSILTPIVITLCYRRKNLPLFFLTTVVGFAQLYFLGTRLAFLAMGVAFVGLAIVMFLTHDVSKRYIAVLAVCFVVCCAFIKVSPMYLNQNRYNDAMASKQGDAAVMMKRASGDEDNPDAHYRALRVIYLYYNKNLCNRYGVGKVMDKYDYTSQISKVTATRHQKIVFCDMLLDEHPWISRVFGMELSRMQFDGNNYDVENDFHGIYFLYGWVGLIMMLAFIGYFLYLIVRALLRDFRKYFTIEAGAFGMALCLALLYAYNTAGVLRRPNSSFYLSVLLAVVYYLIELRQYPEAISEKEAIQE